MIDKKVTFTHIERSEGQFQSKFCATHIHLDEEKVSDILAFSDCTFMNLSDLP